jgi:hypothetical protein
MVTDTHHGVVNRKIIDPQTPDISGQRLAILDPHADKADAILVAVQHALTFR